MHYLITLFTSEPTTDFQKESRLGMIDYLVFTETIRLCTKKSNKKECFTQVVYDLGVLGQFEVKKLKKKSMKIMRFYCLHLTNIAHNFHLLCVFKFVGRKLIPIPLNHILIIANIYNF